MGIQGGHDMVQLDPEKPRDGPVKQKAAGLGQCLPIRSITGIAQAAERQRPRGNAAPGNNKSLIAAGHTRRPLVQLRRGEMR